MKIFAAFAEQTNALALTLRSCSLFSLIAFELQICAGLWSDQTRLSQSAWLSSLTQMTRGRLVEARRGFSEVKPITHSFLFLEHTSTQGLELL